LRAVQDSAAVAELAGNPMLLTILAIIGRRRELPRERRAVYDHAVSVLIEHWDATGKHLHDARVDGGMEYLSREDKLELLRLVARRMQDGPASLAGNHLPGPDLCSEFESFLHRRFQLPASRAAPAARGMLDQLRERNFILARFGAGVYGFVHRAFLEYLAADDISARFAAHEISAEEVTQVFADRWNDPAWHEVLVLISGMIPTPFAGAAISRLLSADPASHIQPANIPTHLHLAIRCFGEVRKPGDIAAQGQAISRELISLLETYDANKRSYSLQSLTSSLVSAAVPILTKLEGNTFCRGTTTPNSHMPPRACTSHCSDTARKPAMPWVLQPQRGPYLMSVELPWKRLLPGGTTTQTSPGYCATGRPQTGTKMSAGPPLRL